MSVVKKAMEAIRSGWYLGEEGFRDKLLGLIDKVGTKVMKRGSIAGAAVRAHGESEAERIIGLVSAELGLAERAEGSRTLRKGDSRKMICAALVKANTSMNNEWLAQRLGMGHPAAMSQLVNRMQQDSTKQKTLTQYGKIFKSKDWYHFDFSPISGPFANESRKPTMSKCNTISYRLGRCALFEAKLLTPVQ